MTVLWYLYVFILFFPLFWGKLGKPCCTHFASWQLNMMISNLTQNVTYCGPNSKRSIICVLVQAPCFFNGFKGVFPNTTNHGLINPRALGKLVPEVSDMDPWPIPRHFSTWLREKAATPTARFVKETLRSMDLEGEELRKMKWRFNG